MGFYPDDISICDTILDFYQTSSNKVDGMFGDGILDKSIKSSTDVPLLIGTDLWMNYLLNFLQPMTDLYIKKYPECNKTDSWGCKSQVNIQHYKPNGGFYQWHCERASSDVHIISRHLVFMTYLNDVNDGGETEFLYQQLKIKPEKGLTLIWPVDWTFTHRGIPSSSEEKFIVTGWYNYN